MTIIKRQSLFGFMACCLTAASGCGIEAAWETDRSNAESIVLPVQVLVIGESNAELRTKVFYGRLTPSRREYLRFPQPGVVEEINVKPGQRVATGDALASLRQSELIARRDKIVQRTSELETGLSSLPAAQRPEVQGQVAALQQEQQQLDAQINQRILKAPFDGIVLNAAVREEDSVSPAVVVIDLVEDQQPVVAGQVSASMLRQLEGDPSIWVSIAGREFEVRVSLVGDVRASKDAAVHSLIMKFASTLPQQYWLFDDVVEARFRATDAAAGFPLPITALRHEPEFGWTVLVAERSSDGSKANAIVRIRTVDVVEFSGDEVLATGQLQPGDAVIADGVHRVVPGQEVKIARATDSFTADSGDER